MLPTVVAVRKPYPSACRYEGLLARQFAQIVRLAQRSMAGQSVGIGMWVARALIAAPVRFASTRADADLPSDAASRPQGLPP